MNNYIYARAFDPSGGPGAIVGWASVNGAADLRATASELVGLCGSGPMMASIVEEYMDDRLVGRFNASAFKRENQKGA